LADQGQRGERRAGITSALFPTILPWRHRSLGPELLAGVLLAAIAIPEQIATARLAGMPATAGLAAFIVGSLAIAIFGSTGPLSVGGDSTIAPVIAASVSSIALSSSPTYRADASLLALMVGLIVMVIGLARMAWIADILSAPVVTGFLAGVGIAIVLRQIPAVLGLTAPSGHGPVETTWLTLRAIGQANGWTVVIAGVVLVLVGGAERFSRRFPGAIVALVASAIAVAAFHLKSHGVAVLGFVPSGLPHIAVPAASFTALRALLLPALAIALVVLAQSAATVRGLGGASSDETGFNRDLIGIGAGSLLAGFVGSFAVDSSPPRTEIVAKARGRTQLAGLSAAAIVLVLVAFAASWLDDVPHATLGAILALIGVRLVRVPELRAIFRFDRIEFSLAFVTLLVVAFVDVKLGMGLAVTLAVLDRTRRTARPRDAVLAHLPHTSNWVIPSAGLEVEQLPGVVVYMLEAPLWFANVDHVAIRIRQLTAPGTGVDTFVLDAAAISDVDYTAGRQLTALARDLSTAQVRVGVARATPAVAQELRRIGFAGVIGSENFHPTVDEAVRSLVAGRAGARSTGEAPS
jgi:MFS superfamily sulfate permease-like transporter